MTSSEDDAQGVQILCPGCELSLPRMENGWTDPKVNASAECLRLCHELCLYTLPRGDTFFIHQVVVDAYAAQHAGPATKPITVAFALIGLCLLLERGHTGKAVQRAHMRLAARSKRWPSFQSPANRGNVTVADVLAVEPGGERDSAIMRWAESVWTAWEQTHREIRTLINQYEER